MSPKVTSVWCPGSYLPNENFDGYWALFEEQLVLSGVQLIISVTLAKLTLKNPIYSSVKWVHG